MASAEDAFEVVVPIGFEPHEVSGSAGGADAEPPVHDPGVPTFLRRSVDGQRGRPTRTSLWVRLDRLAATIAKLRGVLAAAPGGAEGVASLDRFAASGLDDLEYHLLEGRGGGDAVGPTRSGRQVVIELVIDATVCAVVFDPYCREPWMTMGQVALAYGIGPEAMRQLLRRMKAKGLVEEAGVVTRMGTGLDGRRRPVTYLSWHVFQLMAGPARGAVTPPSTGGLCPCT